MKLINPQKIISKIKYREKSDDDMIIIPELIKNNMYRMDLISDLKPRNSCHIIDCGAHIGVFSILAAFYLTKLKIHAFEPFPENYDYLEKNSRNTNIKPYKKAVGIKSGFHKLYIPDNKEKSGKPTFDQWRKSYYKEHNVISVDTIDLASFILNLNEEVFLLKMDLEGYEAKIINNFSSDVLSRIRILVIEEHHRKIDQMKLKQNGFVLLFYPENSNRHFVYYRLDKNTNTDTLKILLNISLTASFEASRRHQIQFETILKQKEEEEIYFNRSIFGQLRSKYHKIKQLFKN